MILQLRNKEKLFDKRETMSRVPSFPDYQIFFIIYLFDLFLLLFNHIQVSLSFASTAASLATNTVPDVPSSKEMILTTTIMMVMMKHLKEMILTTMIMMVMMKHHLG